MSRSGAVPLKEDRIESIASSLGEDASKHLLPRVCSEWKIYAI